MGLWILTCGSCLTPSLSASPLSPGQDSFISPEVWQLPLGTLMDAELFQVLGRHNCAGRQIVCCWWELAQSHCCCSLCSCPRAALPCSSLLGWAGFVLWAHQNLPVWPFLLAIHTWGTCWMHSEVVGAAGAAAGGQMLSPTVLPELWGQFNLLPQAFLGLVPILHVSSVLLSLSHLSLFSSPCILAWPGLSDSPTGQKLDLTHTALTTKFCLYNSKIQSQWAANSVICLCMRVLGAFPLVCIQNPPWRKYFCALWPPWRWHLSLCSQQNAPFPSWFQTFHQGLSGIRNL